MSTANSGSARSRTGWRTLAFVIVLAFVLGIGATALFLRQYRHWLPRDAQAMLDADSGSNATGSVFIPPPESGALPATPDEQMIAARQATLGAQLAALEARTVVVDREARAASGYASRAETVLLIVAARRALDRGMGLDYLEPLLRARFAPTRPAAIAAIVTAARKPVTVADLRLGLDAIAAELATGTRRDGWWAGFRREVAGLIVLRRENEPSPRPADRLMRARQQLDAGQVEAALSEVARMPGAPSAGAWTDAARRYVDAHRALDMLEAAALTAPVPAAEPPPAALTPAVPPAALNPPAR